jgi:hypothetical protein
MKYWKILKQHDGNGSSESNRMYNPITVEMLVNIEEAINSPLCEEIYSKQ